MEGAHHKVPLFLVKFSAGQLFRLPYNLQQPVPCRFWQCIHHGPDCGVRVLPAHRYLKGFLVYLPECAPSLFRSRKLGMELNPHHRIAVKEFGCIGYLYSAGIGTAIDYSEAALWFRKAAEKNHAISQLNLARLLVAVDKLPKPANEDEEKARWAEGVKWFRLAADQGLNVCAHVILGLPGEDREMMLDTARYVSGLPLQGIKIHLLYVVKGTAQADL